MPATPFRLIPLSLVPETDSWSTFGMLEYQATAMLSRLAGMMEASTKPDLFWLTWLLKEAQYSNEIEGTITTFSEVLGEHAGLAVAKERKNDVCEVLNYHTAMLKGINMLKCGQSLSLFMVRALHAQLLDGVRGANKNPGQWRETQVYIGRHGTPIEQAMYIPPNPVHIQSLLENWMTFIKRMDLNPIVQATIMHAQFELIHPFLDGNGRLGRLLITLFMVEKNLFIQPCFYMSAYLQEHRQEYYEALNNISKENNWNNWIVFFLHAVMATSQSNMNLLKKLIDLYEESKSKFAKITASANAIQILDSIFTMPIFTLPALLNKLGGELSQQNAVRILKKLEQADTLKKIQAGRGRLPAVWQFTELFNLLD